MYRTLHIPIPFLGVVAVAVAGFDAWLPFVCWFSFYLGVEYVLQVVLVVGKGGVTGWVLSPRRYIYLRSFHFSLCCIGRLRQT